MIRILCTWRDCREWAVAYASREDEPPREPLPPDCMGRVLDTLWYVCPKHRQAFHKPLEGLETPPVCERCGKAGATWESSRTMYDTGRPTAWDHILENIGAESVRIDPNRDSALCPDCAEEHHKYWDEMWDEYNRGRL